MDAPLLLTKAESLLKLKELLKKSFIEDIVVVNVSEIFVNFNNVYEQIKEKFLGDNIIIRSSLRHYGNIHNAKMIHLNASDAVDSKDKKSVEKALKKMAYMYADNDEKRLPDFFDEQVLIQRYSENIAISGVAFTRDFIYKRPYYMINYEVSQDTDEAHDGRTKWIAKNTSREFLDYDFLSLINSIKEIEEVYRDIEALEIKFGIDSIDNVIIFQVRPLVELFDKPMALTDKEFYDAKSFAKCDYLDTSHVLSDMASWRPAEILGLNPRPLDCSLYKELITSGKWNESISHFGYANEIYDLMQKIGNKPYISVDYTIAGLTPKNLKSSIRFKLKEFYIKKLKDKPFMHERLERDLIFNCYDFATKDKLKELSENGFSEEEISELSKALYEVTSNIIDIYDDVYKKDKEDLDKLTELRRQIRSYAPLKETNIMKVYKYINDLMTAIENYGAHQYIRQSRCDIIARSLMKSLADKGYFTHEEIYKFTSSIETEETKFEDYIMRYIHGEIDTDEFNKVYGHIRLKTFDIRTDCYKNMKLEGIFEGTKLSSSKGAADLDLNVLSEALKNIGFNISSKDFIALMSDMIKNKAYFRFEFIKSVSLILDMIAVLGKLHGIDREDMSYLEIEELISYHSRDSYIQIIQSRRDMYHAYSYLVLPELIFNVGDIDVIEYK
ncbi:MAG: hypothetical protein IJ141_10060 [Lachnospiraceae bacterium]|nr:hypothetical protein [Lachnospiraceae bacterium]